MKYRFHQRRKFASYYLATISRPRASLPFSPKISLSCCGMWCCLEVEKLSSPSISFQPAATPRPVFVPHIWRLLHWLLFSGRVIHYPLGSSWWGPGMMPLHEGHTLTQFALASSQGPESEKAWEDFNVSFLWPESSKHNTCGFSRTRNHFQIQGNEI